MHPLVQRYETSAVPPPTEAGRVDIGAARSGAHALAPRAPASRTVDRSVDAEPVSQAADAVRRTIVSRRLRGFATYGG
jgi:hypothetical protein